MATDGTLGRRESSAAGVDAPNGEGGCNATADQTNEPFQQIALAEGTIIGWKVKGRLTMTVTSARALL